jgi:hypothetical protein
MDRTRCSLTSLGTLVVLGLVIAPTALAHGSDPGDGSESGNDGTHGVPAGETPQYPETYFSRAEFASLIYAHIAFMTLAWVFILPVGMCFPLEFSLCWNRFGENFMTRLTMNVFALPPASRHVFACIVSLHACDAVNFPRCQRLGRPARRCV